MKNPKLVVSIAIISLIVVIVAWSKLRLVGHEGYDAPQRWRVSEFPMPGSEDQTKTIPR